MELIINNLGTIIITIILILIVSLIIISMVRNKKKGKSSCCGSLSGCTHCKMGAACKRDVMR